MPQCINKIESFNDWLSFNYGYMGKKINEKRFP